MSKFRVTIIFDEEFAGSLGSRLTSHSHAWLVASIENQRIAGEYWNANDEESRHRLTTFEVSTELETVLELLDDHYGEFTAHPAIDEILVIGLNNVHSLTPTLAAWDYPVVQQLSEGLLFGRS